MSCRWEVSEVVLHGPALRQVRQHPRFEIGLAELTGSLVIFDKIHAYDAHVTALIVELVRVLRELGGRCLFMSATFPRFLRELLEEAAGGGLAVYRLDKPPALDGWAHQFLCIPRHQLYWTHQPLEELVPFIVDHAQKGCRVLVVANRVQQAQELFRKLRDRLGSGVELLHGRFTRRDRVMREQRILTALRGAVKTDLRVLVATQVVEVSLDVSFDVLVTELPPVDDLLQRLGRVNRYYEQERPAPVVVSLARNEAIRYVYDPERLELTRTHAPPSGTLLTAYDALEWVEAAYRDGWTAREAKRFEQALTSFRNVVASLRPLQSLKTGWQEFQDLFQGVEVLPEGLSEEYTRHVAEGRSLLATQLLVPIPLGTFWKLHQQKRIAQLRDGTLIAFVGYDPELGLLPEKMGLDSFW